MRFNTVVSRALRLRCPVCGKGRIANGLLSTREECSSCGTDFVVEAGYFLGAIYFNYGITVVVVLSVAIPLIFAANLPTVPVVAVSSIFCIFFPLWFFRYARSLWLSLDYYYDQRKRERAEAQGSEHSTVASEQNQRSSEDISKNCICPLCHHRFAVAAHSSRRWSKCPKCYGDVLLVPSVSVSQSL